MKIKQEFIKSKFIEEPEYLSPSQDQNLSEEGLDFFKLDYSTQYYLLFFPLTTQLTLISKEMYTEIFSRNFNELDKVLKQIVLNHNLNFKENLLSMESLFFRIRDIFIDLGTLCNLRCKYCWSDHSKPKNPSFDKIKLYLDFMIKLNENRKYAKLFFTSAGESFLHWELMKQIIEYLSHRVKLDYIHVISNGVISEEIISEYHNRYNGLISYSCDGPFKISGLNRSMSREDFNLLLKNMSYSFHKGKVSGVLSVVTKKTILFEKDYLNFFGNFKNYSFSLGVRKVNIYPFFKYINLPEDYLPSHEEFLKFAKGVIDWYLNNNFHFRLSLLTVRNIVPCYSKLMYSNDDIIQCQLFHRIKNSPLKRYGTIKKREISFENLDSYDSFSMPFSSECFKNKCVNCIAKYLCSGGCPFLNYMNNGSMNCAVSEGSCQRRVELLKYILFKYAEKFFGIKPEND